MTKNVRLILASYPNHIYIQSEGIYQATISEACYKDMLDATKLLQDNPNIFSINLKHEPSLNDITEFEKDIDTYIGVSYLSVLKTGYCWYIQDKWDCFSQIEFDLVIDKGE